MKAVNLISQALCKQPKPLPVLPYPPVTAMCAVTGQETLCLKRKDVLGKSFTNADVLAAPNSEFVGVDVFYAWEYGYRTTEEKKRDKRPERMSSWFCDGETFTELDRQGVRALVFQAAMPPVWTAYATTSYKKHGSLRAHVNTGAQRVWLFEEQRVDCSDMTKLLNWWGVLNTALRAGIGRSVLETGDCPPFLIAKVGLTTWLAFDAWARGKVSAPLYQFLCYLLPSQDELKHESVTMDAPRTDTLF